MTQIPNPKWFRSQKDSRYVQTCSICGDRFDEQYRGWLAVVGVKPNGAKQWSFRCNDCHEQYTRTHDDSPLDQPYQELADLDDIEATLAALGQAKQEAEAVKHPAPAPRYPEYSLEWIRQNAAWG